MFRIGISQFITHQSLDATREGFVDELAKQGYAEGKISRLILQNAQENGTKPRKTISKQLAESSDAVLAIATPSAQSLANTTQTTPVIFFSNRPCQCQVGRVNWEHPGGQCNWNKWSVIRCHFNPNQLDKESVAKKPKQLESSILQSEPVVQKDEADALEEKVLPLLKTIWQ